MKRELEILQQMPKVELHVHVEGATTPETYYELAKKNKVKLPFPTLEEWKDFFKFRDFNHFIEVYETSVSTMQEPADLAYLIEQFYAHQARYNVVHSEAFLSATFLVQKFPIPEVVKAVEEGMKRGKEKHGVSVYLIPDIARHIPSSQDKVLELAIAGYEKGVFVGFGLGGKEVDFPPEMFTEVYQKAGEAGLKLVAHAGETEGPASVRGAVESLNAVRIGHGIRTIEDDDLVEKLAKLQVPMEVSPTSNYHLKVAQEGKPHPIREMVDRGLLCTVNSDDPAMFSTTINQEYALLYEQGFSLDELIQLNRNAIEVSFLPDEEKAELMKQLDDFLAKQ